MATLTTIRKAQGATYVHGCIWFDHTHPPDRGYGYVAASRFKSRSGIYLFGKIRRTDWRPVRDSKEDEADDENFRGDQSADDYDSEEDEDCVRATIRSQKKWASMCDRYSGEGHLLPIDKDDPYGQSDSDCESDVSYVNPFKRIAKPADGHRISFE